MKIAKPLISFGASQEMLLVELQHQSIRVSRVGRRQGEPEVRDQYLISLGSTASMEPAVVAGAIAEDPRSKQSGIRSIAILLPRSSFALKVLQVPPCQPTELDTLVRLATAGRTSMAVEELALGYMCRSASVERTQDVLVATMAAATQNEWKAAFQAVGYDLSGVGVQGVAITPALVHYGCRSGVVAHVTDDECYAIALLDELPRAVVHGVIHADSSRDTQVATLIRRLLLNKVSSTECSTIYVHATDAEVLIPQLRSHFDDSEVAPLSIPIAPERLAALGWMYGAGTTSQLDLFVNHAVNGTKRRPKWIAASLAALLCATAIGAVYEYQCRSWDAEIATLQQTHAELESQIKQYEPVTQAVATISPWIKQRVNWSNEIAQLLDKVPSTQHLALKQIRGELLNSTGQAIVQMTGVADNANTVTEFQQAIASGDAGHELYPRGIRPSTDRSDYPVQFEVEINLHVGQATKSR